MKKLITLFCFSFICINLQAQSFMWADQLQQNLSALTQVKGVVVDANNNLIVSGWFNDTVDFDPGPGTSISIGDYDYFILKLDSIGDFVWVKIFDIHAQSGIIGEMDVDASGNIYVAGNFYGVCDFDPGPGNATLTPTFYDVFILKLDANGDYVWVKQIAGPGFGNAYCLAMNVDNSGNVVAGGIINGTYDFDPNAGVANLGTPGDNNAWILKWDTDGNYIWAKEIVSAWQASVHSVAISGTGDVYFSGACSDVTDLDPNASVYTFADTSKHIYVAKWDASGNFGWAVNYDAELYTQSPTLVNIDNSDNLIVTGIFKNTVDFDPGTGISNLTSSGGTDSYVLKLTSSGNFVWARSFGSTQDDNIYDSYVSPYNTIYSTGFNSSGTVDFDPGPSNYDLTTPYGGGFISVLSSSGNLLWATQNGGSNGTATGRKVITDNSNNIYSIGNFNLQVDFDPGTGVYNLTNMAGSGGGELYVQKLSSLPNTGIPNTNGYSPLNLFPNPTTDFVNLTSKFTKENAKLTIMNLQGCVLMNKTVNIQEGNTLQVNISSLPNGIYIIQLENWIGKFVKQ